MNRKLYLELCQKVSILNNGVCNIKENVPDEFKVVYNDIVYYPVGYELSFKNGQTIHKAILHDLKSSSITYAKLDRVDKFKK